MLLLCLLLAAWSSRSAAFAIVLPAGRDKGGTLSALFARHGSEPARGAEIYCEERWLHACRAIEILCGKSQRKSQAELELPLSPSTPRPRTKPESKPQKQRKSSESSCKSTMRVALCSSSQRPLRAATSHESSNPLNSWDTLPRKAHRTSVNQACTRWCALGSSIATSSVNNQASATTSHGKLSPNNGGSARLTEPRAEPRLLHKHSTTNDDDDESSMCITRSQQQPCIVLCPACSIHLVSARSAESW